MRRVPHTGARIRRAVRTRTGVLALSMVAAIACMPRAGIAQHRLDESEAALLYDTHCRACHTEQVHWRDRRLATDWTSLVGQVRRWQASLQLGWSEHDIATVAHYLNLRYYRFAPSPPKLIVRAG